MQVSKEFRNKLKSKGRKGESYEAIIKRKTVDQDAVAEVARAQRALCELCKKGLDSAESISTQDYLGLQVGLINTLLQLIGEPPLVWKKTKVGGFPVLVAEDEPEPETWEEHIQKCPVQIRNKYKL